MAEIKLAGGLLTEVDDANFEWLNQWRWYLSSSGYATRTQYVKGSGRKKQKNKIIRMHRLITNAPDGLLTDHIDGDKLNNRRSNLRLATHTENHQNRGKQDNNTSGYKGVFLHNPKLKKPWRARITIPGNTNKHLGFFATPELAARAYNKAATEHHGEFARLNDA